MESSSRRGPGPLRSTHRPWVPLNLCARRAGSPCARFDLSYLLSAAFQLRLGRVSPSSGTCQASWGTHSICAIGILCEDDRLSLYANPSVQGRVTRDAARIGAGGECRRVDVCMLKLS